MSSLVERLTKQAVARRNERLKSLGIKVKEEEKPKQPKSYYKPRRERGPDGKVLICINGHPMDDANTYVGELRKNGKVYEKRSCRTCHRNDERRRRRAARREKRALGPGGHGAGLDEADQGSTSEAS